MSDRRLVLVDASVLITLSEIGHFGLLRELDEVGARLSASLLRRAEGLIDAAAGTD